MPSDRPARAFGLGAAVGAAGRPIGIGGAEVRLPAPVGALGFTARHAAPPTLAASVAAQAAALPFRLGEPRHFGAIAPHAPAILARLAGAMTAAGSARGC